MKGKNKSMSFADLETINFYKNNRKLHPKSFKRCINEPDRFGYNKNEVYHKS